MYTLEHAAGNSITWGGEADWVQGLGHVLTDVDLEDGNWTLSVEAPEFETVTATQVMPPRIDSTGSYALRTRPPWRMNSWKMKLDTLT